MGDAMGSVRSTVPEMARINVIGGRVGLSQNVADVQDRLLDRNGYT
jgi:hypothetical protein